MKSLEKPVRKFRLRTTLVVPFVLQIVAAVGLVGYLSFRNGQKAVNDLANQLIEEIGERVDEELQSYLATPQDVSQGMADALDLGLLDLENNDQIRRYLLKQFQQFPSLSWVVVGTDQPNYIDVVYNAKDSSIRTSEWVGGQDGAGVQGYVMDDQGDIRPETDDYLTALEYDHRVRPWYQDSQRLGKPAWLGISVTVQPALLVLSASRPLYNDQNQFLGVLLVDYSLSKINDFLGQIRVGQTGQVFILEQDGTLVASSTRESPYVMKQGDDGIETDRLNAVDSQDFLTADVTRYLSDNQYLQTDTDVRQKFRLNNVAYFLQVSPYQDPQGLNWLVVTAIPESDFMAQINQNARTTFLLCLGALGVAIALGAFTTRLVTGPILRITRAAEEMATGNLDQHVEASSIIEVEKLANSFNSMAGQLKESFETLEDKVEERTAELATANEEISALNEKLKEDNLRMSAELDVAQRIQQMILPKPAELADIPGLDITGYMEPADEVGGDYYDVLYTDGIVTALVC